MVLLTRFSSKEEGEWCTAQNIGEACGLSGQDRTGQPDHWIAPVARAKQAGGGVLTDSGQSLARIQK